MSDDQRPKTGYTLDKSASLTYGDRQQFTPTFTPMSKFSETNKLHLHAFGTWEGRTHRGKEEQAKYGPAPARSQTQVLLAVRQQHLEVSKSESTVASCL